MWRARFEERGKLWLWSNSRWFKTKYESKSDDCNCLRATNTTSISIYAYKCISRCLYGILQASSLLMLPCIISSSSLLLSTSLHSSYVIYKWMAMEACNLRWCLGIDVTTITYVELFACVGNPTNLIVDLGRAGRGVVAAFTGTRLALRRRALPHVWCPDSAGRWGGRGRWQAPLPGLGAWKGTVANPFSPANTLAHRQAWKTLLVCWNSGDVLQGSGSCCVAAVGPATPCQRLLWGIPTHVVPELARPLVRTPSLAGPCWPRSCGRALNGI